jgi:hypothetical protein
MGILLTFKPELAKRQRSEGAKEALGEVLIFTGVRYERHAPAEADPAQMRKAGPLTRGVPETRTAG